jgi:hypothetical protein
MEFSTYIECHYAAACRLQREITRDPLMIEMLREGGDDRDLVTAWMRDYGLFQGVNRQQRSLIVDAFLHYARSVPQNCRIAEGEIQNRYSELLLVLFRQVARSWMSATSKLLWCLYPDDIVILDAFVHRSLVVVQCLDEALTAYPRVGEAPRIRGEPDIAAAVAYYMNYQCLVRHLLSVHARGLAELRCQTNESYRYDIRIMDKLLWMMGNPRQRF